MMYQFIAQNKRVEFIEEIEEIYSKKKNYKSFISYFKRNWGNCNFLNFERLEQQEIHELTDNQCEIFHRKLNQLINRPHPKVSKLIEKLKEYSIEQVHRLAENLILNTENNNNDINIYKDIFKFLKTIKEKYNTSLSLDLLNHLEKEEKDKIKEITISIIKEIFNIELNDDINDNNENIELLSDEELSEDKQENEIIEEENIKNDNEEEHGNEINLNINLFDVNEKKKLIKKKNKQIFIKLMKIYLILKN